MSEFQTMEELRAFFFERDVAVVGLFVALAAVAWWVSNRLAELERVLEKHCSDRWRKWVEDDRAERSARSYRMMGMCPRGHGPLEMGVCKTCGFK